MADTGTHSRLRTRIVATLQRMGVVVSAGAASSGALDLVCCVDGHYCELDVKSGNAQLRPAQKIRVKRVQNAGGIAAEVRSVAEAKAIIARIRHRSFRRG